MRNGRLRKRELLAQDLSPGSCDLVDSGALRNNVSEGTLSMRRLVRACMCACVFVCTCVCACLSVCETDSSAFPCLSSFLPTSS